MVVQTVERARAQVAAAGARAAAGRHARNCADAAQRGRLLGRVAEGRQTTLRAAPRGGGRCQPPGDRGRLERLHPVHPLPACLSRRADERRDRPGAARRARQDRVRHGRPDGRVHLRRLRRVRAGLPDRRVGAGARGRDGGARQAGGIGVPVLRRRLPAHLQRQGQQDPVRQRPRRPGQPQPPVRQGALRLRLRTPSAAPDQAADPPCRCAQARRLHDGPQRRDEHLPRGHVGRGARSRRRHAQAPARPARPLCAGRLRLGQGQQRRGLPVPEAGAHRLRQQQRRPLHAAVPRLQRGGAARGHRLRRGQQPGDGRDAGRGGDPDRRQPDGESSGRGHLDEERRRRRHQADRDGSAAQR